MFFFFNQLTCWISSTNLIPRGTFVLCSHYPANDSYSIFAHGCLPCNYVTKTLLQRVTKSQKVHHLSNKKLEIKKLNFFAKKWFSYNCGY